MPLRGEPGWPGTGEPALRDPDELDTLPGHLFGSDLAHLFDYCRALLGQDGEAARIARYVLDSAQAQLGPDRLRASLFALGRKQALALRPASCDAPSYVPLALIADSSQQAGSGVLRAFRALTDRDREILDLVYRHGIQPAKLPAVVGVPAEEAYRCLAKAEEEFISLAAGPGAMPGAGLEDIAALPLAALPIAEGECQLGHGGQPALTAESTIGLNRDATAVLSTRNDDIVPSGLSRFRLRRLTRPEVVLASALAAALVVMSVLLSGTTGHAALGAAPNESPGASHRSSTSRPAADETYQPSHLYLAPKKPARPAPEKPVRPAPKRSARPAPERPASRQADALPPVAAAAATFVGYLEAGVSDGQVAPPAGQDLYDHLQHLLFGPKGQTTQQIQQQYAQLVQAYDNDRSHGQISGHAANDLRRALSALGDAVGAGSPRRRSPCLTQASRQSQTVNGAVELGP